jgi:D-alanyl-D-alanine carboxypeptidase-like protein
LVPAPAPAVVVVSKREPAFVARVTSIDEGIRSRMGTSWRPGCPVPLQELRVIEMSFWNFDGGVQTGALMVHRRYVDGIVGVFRKLFDARFPIERMVLANGYMGNDPPLALRNNTAGFNCRKSVGSGAWSEHAYGGAVDINPDQNPYVSPSGRVEPPFGRPWMDRSLRNPGMIRPGDVVVEAFHSIGWRWGGTYRRSKDWMHFSVGGR